LDVLFGTTCPFLKDLLKSSSAVQPKLST